MSKEKRTYPIKRFSTLELHKDLYNKARIKVQAKVGIDNLSAAQTLNAVMREFLAECEANISQIKIDGEKNDTENNNQPV